ncbi:MAG: oligosaccharide flippase family protein [Candidatus Saccharibacteria bacterium]|nr:oligosaccharide flippase family protein [Candidatus Saccharibacteria bacterium]
MSDSKKSFINIIAALILLVINSLVSFFLTPFIVKNVGTEANGFVMLASNFINYIAILTIAFNSVASRFVTIAYYKDNKQLARTYYSTVFFSNIFISIFIGIIGIPFIIFLEKFINIPTNLFLDVKVLFLLVLIGFMFNLLVEVFTITSYIANQLYRISVIRLIATIVKASVLMLSFIVFPPMVFFVGLANLTSNTILLILNRKIAKKTLPDIYPSLKSFQLSKLKELVALGIWNAISSVGNIFMDGLDLLISNIFLSSLAMGLLAIPKTLNTLASSLLSAITNALAPIFTISYAKNNVKKLVANLKLSMKINGFFSAMIFCWIFVFSRNFFQVWLPTQDSSFLWLLSILTTQSLLWSGTMDPLYTVYTTTGKLKVNAIVRLVVSMLSVLVVFILLKTTNWGLLVVAATSPILGNLCNLIFTPIYTANCLNIPKITFYPPIIKHILAVVLSIGLLSVLTKLFITNNWFMIVLSLIITALVVFTVYAIIVLDNNDRVLVQNILKNKLLSRIRK